MKYGRYYQKMAVCILMMLIIAFSLTTATYAWFTSNRVVRTDRVVSRSSTDTVELLVSSTGGDDFQGSSEVVINRVNSAGVDELLPVSTADLRNFVYNDGGVDSMAVHFSKTEDDYYYHGRIYLKAEATDRGDEERLALYFDKVYEKGAMFQSETVNVLNAVRLGIIVDGENTLIFRVSEESNPGEERVLNTILNGAELGDDQVIDSSGGVLQAVADPSVPIDEYMVDEDGTTGGNTIRPLLLMEFNRIYTLDIYVYLEGCDPDCSESIEFGGMDFYLAFYGILTREDSVRNTSKSAEYAD